MSENQENVKAPVTTAAILILSLAVWTYFFLAGLPLGAPETVVVVGICAVVVISVKFAFGRLRKRPQAKGNVDP
jgi:hypothetical protein